MDINTVKKVASLARIALKDEEIEKYTHELNGILDWMKKLDEINTDGIEPLANVAEIDLRLREDSVNDGMIQKDILSNAPESMEGFFVVPKVVE